SSHFFVSHATCSASARTGAMSEKTLSHAIQATKATSASGPKNRSARFILRSSHVQATGVASVEAHHIDRCRCRRERAVSELAVAVVAPARDRAVAADGARVAVAAADGARREVRD